MINESEKFPRLCWNKGLVPEMSRDEWGTNGNMIFTEILPEKVYSMEGENGGIESWVVKGTVEEKKWGCEGEIAGESFQL